VVNNQYGSQHFIGGAERLLRMNVLRASLLERAYVIDSPFYLKYIEQRCNCSASSSVDLVV
jgi:hypothetical protein